jgi:hypothetical protein
MVVEETARASNGPTLASTLEDSHKRRRQNGERSEHVVATTKGEEKCSAHFFD